MKRMIKTIIASVLLVASSTGLTASWVTLWQDPFSAGESRNDLASQGWERVAGSEGDGGNVRFIDYVDGDRHGRALQVSPGLDDAGVADHRVYYSRTFEPHAGHLRVQADVRPESNGAMLVLSSGRPFGDRIVVYFRNGESIRLYDGGIGSEELVELPAYQGDDWYRVTIDAFLDKAGREEGTYSVMVENLTQGVVHGKASGLKIIGTPRALDRLTLGVLNSRRARAAWSNLSIEAQEDGALRPLKMQTVPGEVVPAILGGNAVPQGGFARGLHGWELVDSADTHAAADVKEGEGSPFIRLRKTGGEGTVWLVSDAFKVDAGSSYELTSLYRTRTASFGSFGEWVVQTSSTPDFGQLPGSSTRPGRNAHTGNMMLFNSPEGEWRRKTRAISIPDNHHYARVVFILDGPPLTLDLADLVIFKPESDTRVPRPLEREEELPRSEVLRRLEKRPDSVAEVVSRGDAPVLLVDGKPKVPYMQMADVVQPPRGYIREFAEHGIDLHFITLFNKTQHHWTAPQTYQLDRVDDIIWNSVSRNPEGYFIVYLNVLPYPDWHEDFPDSVARNREGEAMVSRHGYYAPASYWADTYRRQVIELVETYIRHIREQPYAKSIIGYYIGGGEDGQFYYQGVRGQQTIQDGQSPGDLPLFRNWLEARYEGDVEALREAWNDETLTFSHVMPPVENRRYEGVFLDPVAGRPQYDFFCFLNEELAMLLTDIAATIKVEAGKPVIVGAYYGRGAAQMVYPLFAQTRVMFKERMIDFMGAQGGYFGWREVGSPGLLNWVYDSLRRHDILPMMELDFRTWFGGFQSLLHDFRVARYWTLNDFINAVARDAGKTFSIGGGVWWMEMVGGWFRDDDIMDFLGEFTAMSQEMYDEPANHDLARIVLVVDEDTFFWTTEQVNIWNGPHYHSLNLQQRAFSLSGVCLDFYYLSDIQGGDPDMYDIYYFINPYYPSQAFREWVSELEAAGKTIVWQYAPGWMTDVGFSLESMEALTGFTFSHREPDNNGLRARFVESHEEVDDVGLALLGGLHKQTLGIGVDIPTDRFSLEGGFDGVLARYVEDGTVATAYRKDRQTGSLVIVLGHPSGLTPRFLSNLADYVGVHRYARPGDMFFHKRSDLVVMHGVDGGEQSLWLPRPMDIEELIHGRLSAQNTEVLNFKIAPGETFWFRLSESRWRSLTQE